MSYMNKTSMLDEKFYEIPQDIPGAAFDLGKDKSGMTLQHRERDYVWRDYQVDGEVVKSPVDIATLPAGIYRLV